MKYLTRYYSQFNNNIKFINRKIKKLKKNFLSFLLFFFLGFFIGNLFGTFVEYIKFINISNSLLILLLIISNEFINFCVYSKKKPKYKFKLYTFLNAFKIGTLLGFFVDSYKVGS